MTAPLQRIQSEAMRRPRPAVDSALRTVDRAPARPTAAAQKAGALPRPEPPAGRDRRAPTDTFRQAVAAAKTDAGAGSDDDDPRPRRRQAPFMVASAILDERADADTLTPAQLVEAMAERGVTISQSTAQALLRELRSPLSTRMASRRPARPADEPRTTGTGNGGRPAARPR